MKFVARLPDTDRGKTNPDIPVPARVLPGAPSMSIVSAIPAGSVGSVNSAVVPPANRTFALIAPGAVFTYADALRAATLAQFGEAGAVPVLG